MTDKPQQPKSKVGRPSTYTPEIGDAICVRLMEGESLRAICRDPETPAISTVMLWVLNEKDFASKYEQARKIQAEVWFDDIVDISARPLIGKKTTRSTGEKSRIETVKGDNVERSRLMVYAKQWALGRMNPKKFGDKVQQQHSGPDGAAIELNHNVSVTDEERAAGIAALFDAARARKSGQAADAAEDLGAPAGTTDSGV